MNRDDFLERTKRVVAERAAYLCSNPDCRQLTVSPHTDPERSSTSGVAAHILAASPGGPRYDESQSRDERRSAENAIWLCHTCSDRVDKDTARYTPHILRGWKQRHEKFIAYGGMIPDDPLVELRTIEALSLIDHVTEGDCNRLREHVLDVGNRSDVTLRNLRLHFRLPEKISVLSVPEPKGVAVAGERFAVDLPVAVVGSAIVVGPAKLEVPNCVRFFIERLEPEQKLTFRWLSEGPIESAAYPDGIGVRDGKTVLFHFLRGRFHYRHLGALLPKTFWNVVQYDPSSRSVSLGRPLSEAEVELLEVANPRPSATGEYWG